MDIRILVIGDVVGKPGRQALAALLPAYRQEQGIDLCVVNGENAAGGSGLTPDIVSKLRAAGADVITSGDHIWKCREVYPLLDTDDRVLRPANYPSEAPGGGVAVVALDNGVRVGIVNLLGRVFMKPVDCPFRAAEKALSRLAAEETRVILVDMHCEATSEKVAMGWFLNGKVSGVFGTHTHIQTADECVLPGGTGYITDIGMTGPYASVIGREVEPVLKSMVLGIPARFEVAKDDVRLCGAMFTVEGSTGKAQAVERVCLRVTPGS